VAHTRERQRLIRKQEEEKVHVLTVLRVTNVPIFCIDYLMFIDIIVEYNYHATHSLC